jgi:hypothetical protein
VIDNAERRPGISGSTDRQGKWDFRTIIHVVL